MNAAFATFDPNVRNDRGNPKMTTQKEKVNMTDQYTAFGRTYLASGWTPIGQLFHFVPGEGDDNLMGWAERARRHGPSGLLAHGSEEVTHVERAKRDVPAPRRPVIAGLGAVLPAAPDGSVWRVSAVNDNGVTLTYQGARASGAGRKRLHGETEPLTWSQIKEAAEGNDWYATLYRRTRGA